jgi:LysR family transcriptional regulator, hca operon transcriptional activator
VFARRYRRSPCHLLRLRTQLVVASLKHTLLGWERCFKGMGVEMELRHLRYFVAVAEARSLTVAAKRKLHTSQPSLSRQIRDLETEVGAQLMTRTARGIELTSAGRAFLDHARLVLSQVEAAAEAARRVAHPAKPCFSMGFLTGHEWTWMPETLRILRHELPNVDVMISSQYSPRLARALLKGTIDAAFLRREKGMPELAYRALVKEPLMVILPVDHRLAALKSISPRDLAGETFITVSNTAPVLRVLIDNYLKGSKTNIRPAHEGDHLSMGFSLIASTRGVALLPAYAQNFLPSSLTSRPLKGKTPTIELVLGYKKSNESPILKLLLSRLDELIARVSKNAR